MLKEREKDKVSVTSECALTLQARGGGKRVKAPSPHPLGETHSPGALRPSAGPQMQEVRAGAGETPPPPGGHSRAAVVRPTGKRGIGWAGA